MSGWDIGAALRRQCAEPWNRGLPEPEPPPSSSEELILWRGVFQDFIDWNTQVGELLGLILSDATPSDLEELQLAAESCSRGSLLARTCREMGGWMQTCCDFREAHLSGGSAPCFDLGAVLRWEAHKARSPDGGRSAQDSPAEMALLTCLQARQRGVPAWGWALRTMLRAPTGEAAYHPRTRRQGAVEDLILDAMGKPESLFLVEVFRGEAGGRHVAELHAGEGASEPLIVIGPWPLPPITKRLLVSQGWPEGLANLAAICQPPSYITP